jgi:hypothetical protein
VAVGTLEYLLREMQHPEGGFFSSQDADSEGVEGRFFVWAWDELAALARPAVARALGASPEGNWEGTNVLWRPVPVADVAASEGEDPAELEAEVDQALETLVEVRERRVHPAIDDKILAAWNALAIGAFAEAGRVFGEPAYVEAAERCASFVLEHLRDERGRLLRSWRDGVPGRPGFADDHASLAAACLTLYETTYDVRWFAEARALADELLRLFRDEERGGFFQTGTDAEPLLLRPKDLYDNAVPSGNSTAAEVLVRLGLLTGDRTYEEAGASALRLVRDAMAAAPTGFGQALCAIDLFVGPTREIAIVGPPSSDGVRALAEEAIVSAFRPNVVLAVADANDPRADAVPLLRDRPAVHGRPTAYVCERFVCALPVTDVAALREQLTG